MAKNRWEAAVSEYKESKSSGSSSNSKNGKTSNRWEAAVSEYKNNSSETYKELGKQRQIEFQRKRNRALVGEDIINSFLSNRNLFYRDSQKDMEDGNWSQAIASLENRKKQGAALKEQAKKVSNTLDTYMDYYNPEYYNSMQDYLANFDTDIDKAISSLEEYLGQWNSEDAYNKYIEQKKDYEARRTLDLDQANRELAELEKNRNNFAENYEYDWTDAKARSAYDLYLQDLDKQISDKRQFTNRAKRLQEYLDLSSVTGNDDFAANSGYVSTEENTPINRLANMLGLETNRDITYEYINNRGVQDQVRLNHSQPELEAKNYDMMTEEEVGVYNYYYATEGAEKAQQYLDNIQEDLNYRKANKWAQDMVGNTAQEYVFGAAAGLNQSGEDVKNFANTDDDYLNYSAYQIASPQVREDLADNGIKLPEALGGASLGQVVYDIINTGANMLPAMAASTAAGFINPTLGKVVGSALMGMSAGGGAYQEALNEGYSKEQARKYGVESGAAEAGMEYLLGGIGAFSNGIVGIDDAIEGVANPVGRFLLNLGKGMGSEAVEEGLQEYISPMIKNRNLYTDEKASGSDIAYASLLGGLTGGVMDLPGTVSSTFSRRSSTGSSGSQSGGEAVTAPEIKTRVSADGNAKQISTNENVDVVDFASVNNGEATIMLRSGKTASYNDISFASEGEANQFYAVESLPGIDTENANNLLHTIKEADAGKDIQSVAGIREAYGMGYYGAQETDLTKGTDSSTLSTSLQKAVFDIGRQQRNADALVAPTATAVDVKPAEGYKKVVFEGKVNENNNKRHAAEIAFVDYIADNFSGNTVHIYESFKGRDGKYYYRDSSGDLHKAPNGKYVNGEIWLDLKSGDNGKGLMLNTFSHEMYHHIEKFNKTKAQELAQFVSRELGYENVEKGVAEQIKKARKAGLGESYFERMGMSKEQARNEVYTRAMSDFVADSLETMFTRGNPQEAIARLKSENRTLFDEIKNFIDKWVSKLKQYYSDKTVTKEGEVVAQLEKFEELQQLFMEAMQGAGENYKKAKIEDSKPTDASKFQERFSLKDGLYEDIESRRYWYPNMSKSEIADVKSLADYEAKTTDNYLGIEVKWLYNNQKGHEYFALYSTADAEGTTLLYACKNARANHEYDYLQKRLQREEIRNESNNQTGSAGRLLSSIRNALSGEALSYGGSGGRGSNNGNVATHSGNGRRRLSPAFRNCLENIAKVQSRYGLDDHYLFAVDRGDYKTAQQIVDKAAKKAGYTVKAWHGTPIKGITVFDANKIGSTTDNGLFGRGFYFSTSKVTADGYAKESGKTMPVFLQVNNPWWANQYHDIDHVAKTLNMSRSSLVLRKSGISNVVAPLMSQSSQFTSHLKGLGYDSVIVQHGKGNYEVIIFDNNMIKSADAITYDDNGTVIPISQRFNSKNKDIRYSLRNEVDTPRTILSRIDPNSRKLKSEQQHLGFYQERLRQLSVAENKLKDVNARIKKTPENNKLALQKLQREAQNIQHNIDILNREIRRAERSDMFKRIVAEERKKESDAALRSYKKEQKEIIKTKDAENRAIREELTGTQSVMSIMEDEFVRLAKDLEAKKIDLKTMQEMFINQSKQYDNDTQKWLREYRQLMAQYRKLDAKNDRNFSRIEQLEEIIQRQRNTARERVAGRKNTEMRHKIQRKADELNRILIHGTKHRNVPEYLQPVVADILKAINMEVRDGEQRRKAFEATLARYDRQIAMTNDPDKVAELVQKRNAYEAKGDQFANKMAELKEAYEQIQKDKIPGMELDEGLSAHLMELFVVVGDTPLGQMTSEQLAAVNDVLNITKATITNANKLLAEDRAAGVVENSKNVIREIRKFGETAKKKLPIVKGIENFGWNNLKPVYAFDVIGSKTLTNLYNSLRNGEDTLAVDLNEAKTFFQEQWQKHHGKDWDMDKRWKFTSTSGKSFKLDLNQIMSLYAMSKDQDALSHLRVGGFAFDSNYQTKEEINLGIAKIPVKMESTDATAYNLSDEILGEIISKLTPDQRAFADAMQAYLSDTMAAKGNEVSLKKYGIRLFKKKNYFPIRVADQFMAKVREQQSGDRFLKNAGFTKDRKPEAKNPVVLSAFTELWAEHVDEMSLYHSFVLPLDDFDRVLNYHDAFVEGEEAVSVVAAIRNAYGDGATNYIDQLIKDVNGGVRGSSTVSFANQLMSKAKKAQTMASLSVAIQQPSSIIRAMSMIDSKYFIGNKVTEKNQDRIWDEIKKYAPIAHIKEMGGFDTNVGKSTVDYLTDTSEYKGFWKQTGALFTDNKFRKDMVQNSQTRDDYLGRLPAFMDEVSWSWIWNAVKREQRAANPGMNVNSDAFMNLVSKRFTEVITRTQVYDSVFSRSGVMRDKNDLAKMATSFMAEPTTTANMLAVSILQAKRGDINKVQAAKTTGTLIASLAVNSALVSIVYAARDDGEDKRYDEKWIENFVENFFNSLNPATYIPFVRDCVSLAMGFNVDRADMALFGDLKNAIDGIDNEDISAWEKTSSVIGAIGNLFGIPVRNILRDVKGIVQTFNFAFDDNPNPSTKTGRQIAGATGALSAAKGIYPFVDVKKYSNGEEMLLAIQRGDEAHIQRVFGRFESQKEAEGALQSVIREQYLDGKLSKNEVQDLLTTNFDRDDEYDVYWIMDNWDYAKEHGNTDGYSKMGALTDSVESGNYEAEIQRYLDHGTDASTIRSTISKAYRKEYLEADEATREQIQKKLLPVYEFTGMYKSDVMDKFNDWDFEAEYGMTYSEFKSEYADGNFTESEMRKAMKFYGMHNYEIEENITKMNDEIRFANRYGMSLSDMYEAFDNGDVARNKMIAALRFSGKTETEATELVREREIGNRMGIDHSKLDDAYKYGDITRQEFYNTLRQNGLSVEETEETMLGYDWLKQNVKKHPDLQISDARRFVIKVSDKMEERTLTDYGVSIDAYVEYKEKAKDCKGVDANGDGVADPNTKAKQLFAMIDTLPISDEAKTGLALVTNAKSTIKKFAPWY